MWEMMRTLIEYVCSHWHEPDSGIWEVRGGPRHFLYSKVMCWVALDRGIRAAQQLHLEADLPRWCFIREQIRTSSVTTLDAVLLALLARTAGLGDSVLWLGPEESAYLDSRLPLLPRQLFSLLGDARAAADTTVVTRR